MQQSLHNAKIKYYLIENEQVSILKIFIIDTQLNIYEVKTEIVSLDTDSTKYEMKLIKTNIANIEFPLLEIDNLVNIITKLFLPLCLNEKLMTILDNKFFSSKLDTTEMRRRISKIETILPQYPALSVAFFRILDGLLALMYARNTLEMKPNITSFFSLQQEHRYRNPNTSVIEYCLCGLNRV